MAKQKDELSVIVQLSESSVIGLKSDLSKLSSYQSYKLRDFIASVLEVYKPKTTIREISIYPETSRVLPVVYPVGNNRNYGGL